MTNDPPAGASEKTLLAFTKQSITLPDREEMLAVFPKLSCGAEIGVMRGDFSEKILQIVSPRRLYLVDYWNTGPYFEDASSKHSHYWHCQGFHLDNIRRTLWRFRQEIADGLVRPICDLSVRAQCVVVEGELDWIYIDANHSFESVLADLVAWYPAIRPGGIISGHDWRVGGTGVAEAILAFRQSLGITSKLELTGDKRGKSFWFTKPGEANE